MTENSEFYAPISEQIWDMKYRFKDEKGAPIDLSVRDTWLRIAGTLSLAETDAAQFVGPFYEALENFKFLPAGRITAGAGTDRTVTLFNCYVMGTIPDSMDGIFEMLKEAALTMQQGGGIGYDFSPIRPKGSLVKKLGADASGPLTFMDVWDSMCRTVMSAGSRRGAMMATMRCTHPDILDFIDAKKDSNRLRMFNLSVLVTDEFMEAVNENLSWDLYHVEPPNDGKDRIEKYAGSPEDKGEFLGYVHRTVKARDLWDKIMRATYEYAEPGVIFIDRINETNNLRAIETITATNPCGEQPLPPYGACLLGSINLPALVKNAFRVNAGIDLVELRKLVTTAVRMMDNVIDVSNFPLEQQREEALRKRRIGLGVTGLADALIMCGLRYGSDGAVEKTESWLSLIEQAAYRASVALAKEKGAFPEFSADKYLEEGTQASKLPEGIQRGIRENGIRNALLTSIAPTGTISLYAGNVSSGIEPVFAAEFTRKVLQSDGTKTEEVVTDYALSEWRKYASERGIDEPFPPGFVTTEELSADGHIAMQAAAQKYIDSSISKTINLPENISFEAFKNVYFEAFERGCKGCTTYRPNDVTGSVLSVEPKKAEEPWSDTAAFLVAIQDQHDRNSSDMGQKESYGFFQSVCELFDVAEAKDCPVERRSEFLDFLMSTETKIEKVAEGETYEVPSFAEFDAMEPARLSARPDTLPASVYKVKMGDDPAFYVTISDITENGQRRPFEVFINTKNPEHIAWMTALTRMVSAIFRRPHDSSFVVEELKNVFDPKGGNWWRGKYRPSVVAAVGQVIEDHMREIGYGDYREDATREAPASVQVSEFNLENVRMVLGVDGPPELGQRGPFCPVCHSFSVKVESGCMTCLDCAFSKCG